MRCAVGVDDSPSTRGALAFARWMAAEGSIWAREPPSSALSLVAIHVLEDRKHAYTPTLVEEMRPRVEAFLGENGWTGWYEGPYLPFGSRPGPTLLQEARARASDLIVVGRPAHSPQTGLGRLGSTARHLLRT